MSSKTASALSLYRSLLRAHSKYLPTNEMKKLGDAYVKNEFRLHAKVTNPEQLQNFFTEWNAYLHQLQSTARAQQSQQLGILDDETKSDKESSNVFTFGQDLPPDIELSKEQTEQLEKLKEEAIKAGKEL